MSKYGGVPRWSPPGKPPTVKRQKAKPICAFCHEPGIHGGSRSCAYALGKSDQRLWRPKTVRA